MATNSLGVSKSSTLLADELLDASLLARKLKGDCNNCWDSWEAMGFVTSHVAGRLSAGTRAGLAARQAPPLVPEKLRQSLVVDLNAMFQGDSLWDAAVERSVAFREGTKALGGSKPTGESLAYLNRLILEDACPRGLWRNEPGAAYFTYPDRTKHPARFYRVRGQ